MSSPNSSLAVPPKGISQEFDLGLELPTGFDLQSLFPHDRLLRLHPHWFITDFKQDGSSFSANIKDYATDNKFYLAGTVIYPDTACEFMRITLSNGLEKEIIFLIQDKKLKARIISIDGPIEDNDPVLLWIRGIREYIRLFLKQTPTTLFFRLLMNRMVLQMDPSQRKISMMIAKVTVMEVLVIVLIVVGYVFFVQ